VGGFPNRRGITPEDAAVTAKDAGSDGATLKIAASSGCSCLVAGPEPSRSRLPFLFVLGLCLARLTRRRSLRARPHDFDRGGHTRREPTAGEAEARIADR